MAKEFSFRPILYILDMAGVQFTTPSKQPRNRPVATPHISGRLQGSQSSLRDYYVFIKAGLVQHITEPYMSMTNGRLCVTGSTVFRDNGYNNYILCIGFDP